jgi:hypothetical protein
MMRLLVLTLISAVLATLPSAPARAAQPPFHELWRDGPDSSFDGWSLRGVRVQDGRLVLAPDAQSALTADTAEGLAVPDGIVGLALAPVHETAEPFQEMIASWNAETPPATWIEIHVRARVGDRWTAWYDIGAWSMGEPGADHQQLNRHQSTRGQQDADARVLTDTIALKAPASAHQLALVLRSDMPSASPSVSLAAVLASTPSPTARSISADRSAWGTTLEVPQRSQMVYPNGGPVWCSPTSISMVMAYWSDRLGEPALNQTVPAVAAAVYDPVYRGNGNWPFNTAYAAQHGLEGYVSRMSSMAQVERWVEAGIPVVASLAWNPGDLGNASVPSTDGHLLVIVGFTPDGNVIVNDPAANPNLGQSVRRVYDRSQLEGLWLEHSGGTVYLIYPSSVAPPSTDVAFGAW